MSDKTNECSNCSSFQRGETKGGELHSTGPHPPSIPTTPTTNPQTLTEERRERLARARAESLAKKNDAERLFQERKERLAKLRPSHAEIENAVRLNLKQVRAVIEDLTLPGTDEKIKEIGRAFEDRFYGRITEKQHYLRLLQIVATPETIEEKGTKRGESGFNAKSQTVNLEKAFNLGDPPAYSSAQKIPAPGRKTLYVGNLPFQTTEEELGNWFKEAGLTPASVTLVRDGSGQSHGFGFVEMNNDDANCAIQALNGEDFKGRKIVISEARQRS